VCYKARLVAQGFTQSFSIHYDGTYAPVAKFASTRIILTLTTQNDWEVEQVDVKNAYLNVELTETIYMAQPLGFALPGHENHVCRLLKALYGLKQASRCWYKRICEAFAKFGYTRCTAEHCIFYRWHQGKIIIIVVAVDDLLLTSSSRRLLLESKTNLKSEFSITEMGEVHWLLGVEVK